MHKRLPLFFKCKIGTVCCALMITACSSSMQPMKGDTQSLEGLQELSMGNSIKNSKTLNTVRSDALQQTALSTGAQSGLAWRSKQINAVLDKNSSYLDRAFNFSAMMLDHNVVPPILTQGNESLNLDNDQAIRIADRTYKIETQARFVTTPPTWRDYLWMNYPQPPPPDASLLPQNSLERNLWKQYVKTGWQNGIDQANTLYSANLARLQRDYTGMIRYRILLSQHMVSAPFVARTDLGITGGGSDMRINDQVLRITALPQLQANSRKWKPVPEIPLSIQSSEIQP